MSKEPIFIGWTRSFWFGIVPALLVALDVLINLLAVVAEDPSLAPPVASLLAWLTGGEAEAMERLILSLAPLFAFIIAHQRRGEARPYTIDPRARE